MMGMGQRTSVITFTMARVIILVMEGIIVFVMHFGGNIVMAQGLIIPAESTGISLPSSLCAYI